MFGNKGTLRGFGKHDNVIRLVLRFLASSFPCELLARFSGVRAPGRHSVPSFLLCLVATRSLLCTSTCKSTRSRWGGSESVCRLVNSYSHPRSHTTVHTHIFLVPIHLFVCTVVTTWRSFLPLCLRFQGEVVFNAFWGGLDPLSHLLLFLAEGQIDL